MFIAKQKYYSYFALRNNLLLSNNVDMADLWVHFFF